MSDMETILTPQGFADIQTELHDLLSVQRPKIVERIHEARQLGDLRENFDYEDGKRSQAMLEARICELKAILAHSIVVECSASDGCVGIGLKVIVKDLEEGFEDEYMIVGPAESSPSEGKISHESCVGKALMGRRVGDVVTVQAPGGAIKYEIVSVQ